MRLYVIGDFQYFSKSEVIRLMGSCDACMLAERSPIVGEIYSTLNKNMQVRIIKVEYWGKVVTVDPVPGPDLS